MKTCRIPFVFAYFSIISPSHGLPSRRLAVESRSSSDGYWLSIATEGDIRTRALFPKRVLTVGAKARVRSGYAYAL